MFAPIFPEIHISVKATSIPPDDISWTEFTSFFEISENTKDEVSKILEKNSIYYEIIGKTQKESLNLDKDFDIKLTDLDKYRTSWFKNYFKEN